MYNVGKYQIHLHLLRNRTEKLARLLFYLFLKLVQINYIFSDNVCTCIYAKLSFFYCKFSFLSCLIWFYDNHGISKSIM
jgi:hypothetical protein